MTLKIRNRLCLFCLILFIFAHGAYAANENVHGKSAIEMKLNYGNYNTDSSWFMPYIVRNLEGGHYAWTVTGSVWFTKASGKWPKIYWESGGYTPPIHRLDLPTYRSSQITAVQIHMTAIRLPEAVSNSPKIFSSHNRGKVEFTQDITIKNNTIIKNEITKY